MFVFYLIYWVLLWEFLDIWADPLRRHLFDQFLALCFVGWVGFLYCYWLINVYIWYVWILYSQMRYWRQIGKFLDSFELYNQAIADEWNREWHDTYEKMINSTIYDLAHHAHKSAHEVAETTINVTEIVERWFQEYLNKTTKP